MSKRLGTLLLQAGVLSEEELQQALAVVNKGKGSLWDLVVSEKKVDEEVLAQSFAKQLRLPYVKLAATQIDAEAIKALSEELARKYTCIPLKTEGKSLILSMANPSDYDVLRDIEFVTGYTVKPVVSTRTEVLDAIEKNYAPDSALKDFMANIGEVQDFTIMASEQADADTDKVDIRSQADLPPVVKMVNLMIHDSIKGGASDIHIEATLNDVQVRNRVDGVLRDFMQVPKWLHNPIVSRLKILARLDIAERRVPQDGRIKVQVGKQGIDLRVSTLPTHFGEKVVMRVLASASDLPSLKRLGIEQKDLDSLANAIAQPQGMVLVTGPTGSGKTTTLYSILNEKKSPEINIITVEDPIEIQLHGLNQVQVNVKAGLTFAACLRSILRQDPDVILLGEIRDLETAEIAFHAAMTGHLVFSTLHTNSSIATIGRLLDLGIDPYLVSSSVLLILAQRLARRICTRCQEAYTPSSKILDRLRIDEPGLVFYRGRGCEACGKTGYSGRVGIYEFLRITPGLRELINRKAPEPELRKAAGLAGTTLLLQDAMLKVKKGITTLEEVLRVIQIQEDEIVHCPNCNSFINLDFTTCPYCLYSLKIVCQSCGQELKPEWRICPYCSMRVTHAGEAGEKEAGQVAASGFSGRPAPAAKAALTGEVEEQPGTPTGPRAIGPGSPDGDMGEMGGAGPAAAGGPGPQTKRPKILVVDDDEGIKRVLTKTLEQLPVPAEVLTAANGIDALTSVEHFRPDLIILDVMMPEMDGFEVCQKLRSNIHTAFIPIMMLTGNVGEESRTRGYLVGTDDYVNKPFSVPELNARVLRLLRRTYGL